MEKETGLKLIPTYAYLDFTKNGDELKDTKTDQVVKYLLRYF